MAVVMDRPSRAQRSVPAAQPPTWAEQWLVQRQVVHRRIAPGGRKHRSGQPPALHEPFEAGPEEAAVSSVVNTGERSSDQAVW